MNERTGRWICGRVNRWIDGQIVERPGRWMNRQVHFWTDRLIYERTGRWMNGQASRWTDGQTDERTGRWMNGQVNGRKGRRMDGYKVSPPSKVIKVIRADSMGGKSINQADNFWMSDI